MSIVAVAAMSGVPMPVQTAAASGNGTIVAPPMSFRNHSFLIQSSAGVSAGAVQPETSMDPTDTNAWAPVGGGPVTIAAALTDTFIEFTGIYVALRLRISTPIVGGTINALYNGGKNY